MPARSPTAMEHDAHRRSSAGFERVHVDIGALQERVRSTEKGISDISQGMSSLRSEMMQANSALSDSLTSQIREVGRSLSEQQSAFNKSRSTNWPGVITLACSVVGVAIVIGGLVVAPIYGLLNRHDLAIRNIEESAASRVDLNATKQGVKDDLELIRRREDAQSEILRNALPRIEFREQFDEFKNRIDERSRIERDSTIAGLADLSTHLSVVDSNLVKRPEIEALLSAIQGRVEALSRNFEDARREWGATYTIGDQVKQMQEQLNTLLANSRNRDKSQY